MMITSKMTYIEKQKIDILKLYLLIYPIWRKMYETQVNHKELLTNIIFLDFIIFKHLTTEEINIITKGIMTKSKGNEYIALEFYYSESGFRNHINIICKKLVIYIDTLVISDIY